MWPGENQKMKVAAIEAEWKTETPPAGFTAFGLPDVAQRRTRLEVKIPWMLGLIATRSIDQPVTGIEDLVARAQTRIEDGAQGLCSPADPAPGRERRGCESAVCLPPGRFGLRPVAAQVQRMTLRRRRRSRSRKPHGLRYPTCRCSFGAFGSWSPSVCSSSRCSRRHSICPCAIASSGIAGPPNRRVEPAPALAGSGTRLGRGRIRPSTLGDRRSAADLPGSIAAQGGQCVDVVARFRDFLHGSCGDRHLP